MCSPVEQGRVLPEDGRFQGNELRARSRPSSVISVWRARRSIPRASPRCPSGTGPAPAGPTVARAAAPRRLAARHGQPHPDARRQQAGPRSGTLLRGAPELLEQGDFDPPRGPAFQSSNGRPRHRSSAARNVNAARSGSPMVSQLEWARRGAIRNTRRRAPARQRGDSRRRQSERHRRPASAGDPTHRSAPASARTSVRRRTGMRQLRRADHLAPLHTECSQDGSGAWPDRGAAIDPQRTEEPDVHRLSLDFARKSGRTARIPAETGSDRR